MNSAGKTISWVCIFSVLFMSCYSSAMIDPTGDEKDRVYSDKIEFVVTKDGTKYVFALPPAIVKDSLVGIADGKKVAIALSDVSKVYVTKSDPVKTVTVVGGVRKMLLVR